MFNLWQIFIPRNFSVFKIQCELITCPKSTRKVSGFWRNVGLQDGKSWFQVSVASPPGSIQLESPFQSRLQVGNSLELPAPQQKFLGPWASKHHPPFRTLTKNCLLKFISSPFRAFLVHIICTDCHKSDTAQTI